MVGSDGEKLYETLLDLFSDSVAVHFYVFRTFIKHMVVSNFNGRGI